MPRVAADPRCVPDRNAPIPIAQDRQSNQQERKDEPGNPDRRKRRLPLRRARAAIRPKLCDIGKTTEIPHLSLCAALPRDLGRYITSRLHVKIAVSSTFRDEFARSYGSKGDIPGVKSPAPFAGAPPNCVVVCRHRSSERTRLRARSVASVSRSIAALIQIQLTFQAVRDPSTATFEPSLPYPRWFRFFLTLGAYGIDRAAARLLVFAHFH